jgi:hypothetical protein
VARQRPRKPPRDDSGRERERRPEPDNIDHVRGPRAPHDPDHPRAAAAQTPRWNLAPTVFAAEDQQRDQTLMPGAVLVGRF